jgi:hypothetical protein
MHEDDYTLQQKEELFCAEFKSELENFVSSTIYKGQEMKHPQIKC